MNELMTWGQLLDFVKLHPEMWDKPAVALDNDIDTLYNVDFIQFVDDNDILPVGEVSLVFTKS